MEKNIINKMSAEVFGQMSANGDISDNFSSSLKKSFLKIGATAVLAGMLAMSSGIANAGSNDTRNATMSIAGLWGVLTSGSVPNDIASDCDVSGTSGLKVGGAGALGAYAGSHVGGGTGKEIATVVGGIVGAAAAQSAEEDRMRRECAKKISQKVDKYGIPTYATNSANVQSPILYEGRTTQGKSFYVTIQSSPGIAGLSGKVVGALEVSSDILVRDALDRGYVNLANSYENFDNVSKDYLRVINGETTISRVSRYAVDGFETAPNSELNRQNRILLEQSKKSFEVSYNNYAQARSRFFRVADNAVVDGYNITSYQKSLDYLTPPESATVTYSGKLENRYAVIPNAVKSSNPR